MTPRPWEPEAVAQRRAERRQRRALLIAGAVTAIVVLIAVVAAMVADDDEPAAQGGPTTQTSTSGATTVSTSGRSSTTSRASTTTSGRATTTQRPGASTSSAVPSSTGGQGATTVVDQTTVSSPTSGAPSPTRVPPVDQESTTTTTTSTASSNPTAAAGTLDNPVPFGTAAAIGEGWNFSVSTYVPDATKDVLAEDEFNEPPPDGYQYALATVAATYNGTDPTASMFDVDVGVIAPSDFETDMFSCPVVVPKELDTSAEVSPGDTVTGNVCFELPNADATTVVIYATAGFVSDDIFFALR